MQHQTHPHPIPTTIWISSLPIHEHIILSKIHPSGILPGKKGVDARGSDRDGALCFLRADEGLSVHGVRISRLTA